MTGLLSESDKVVVELDGDNKKAERYIRTVKHQSGLSESCVEVVKEYDNFKYLYFSKTIQPFKTPGVYGFSHGGVSPQELVTPYFCWERTGESAQALQIQIQKKSDLKNVTGDLFELKLSSDKGMGDLFSLTRKVFLVFFCKKVQINKSDIFSMQRDQEIAKEYSFDGHSEIEVQLLDAETKEQLDRAVVIQNKDRDLGGLL